MPRHRRSPGSQRIPRERAPSREGASRPDHGWATHLKAISLLGGMLALTFANTLRNTPFLLDSKLLILEDPRLRAPFPQVLRQIFGQDYWWPHYASGLYRPITTFSYFLNYSILGHRADSAGYHWVNVAVHVLNAVLVYVLAMILLKNPRPAVLVAALFGVHPIVTEAVTNIVGRADLLAALAVLSGLLFHIESTVVTGGRRICCLVALAACLLFGVFAKESALVLPGVIVLYDFTYRFRTGEGRDPGIAGVGSVFIRTAACFWRFARRDYVAWLPGLLAFWWVRSRVFAALPIAERPVLDNPLIGADFWTARATAIGVVGRYLGLLLWPRRLSCDYSYNQVPLVTWRFSSWGDVTALLSLLAIIMAVLVIWLAYPRNRPPGFFILFFFVTLLPTSNLIVPIGSIMAERFLYLPLVGFAGCFVLAVQGACRAITTLAARARTSVPSPSTLALGLLLTMTIACAVRTSFRNLDWADEERLWSRAVQACPNSYKTHGALARAIFDKDPGPGSLDRVIEEAEKAVEIAGRSHIALTHLGFYYRIKGDLLASQRPEGAAAPSSVPSSVPSSSSVSWYQKSVEALLRAVPLDHSFNEENRSREVRRGKKPEEIADTGSDEIYWNLGTSYMRLGKFEPAMEAFLYSRHLAPMNPDAYVDIASVLTSTGRAEQAVIPLLQSLVLQANREDALRSLVEIYRQIDAGGCSLIPAPGQPRPRLNTACPRVRRDICAAHAGLADVFVEARQPALAQKIREKAAMEYSCPPPAPGESLQRQEPRQAPTDPAGHVAN